VATDITRFTRSDLVAGYVTSFDEASDSYGLRTSDGGELECFLTSGTFGFEIRNFGEDYRDCTAALRDMLVPERYAYAYGIFYPEGDGHRFEVSHMVFCGDRSDEFRFEEPSWWVDQARAVADFYLRGQFPDGNYDWRQYRTQLTLAGTHPPATAAPEIRQETDTISRLVYGLATAYLLTGEPRFIDAAERGTEYLRDHMRVVNEREGVVFWYHGIDVSASSERKIYASSFGDDYDAIPMYEQIYALVGLTQTYRVTGDPRILEDIEGTLTLFERFFRDHEGGGYFSHIDPVDMNARSERLGHNRARKNWNSVGDHAPAYLINALLATGREDLADFLVRTADTILERFPDDDHSPFVQERFHEDWKADRHWIWQQDNAVIGHNLKIAWNLMRVHHLRPNDAYVALAEKIARVMPDVGSDQQRGGWYDVVERTLQPNRQRRRFVWHDRKAWWQQEQSILAYLILHGSLGQPEHLRHAREAESFYNAFFLDHDDGGVYYNVLANGIPYLVGTERLKGSHSMSGYHTIELCYLAAVYNNLLIAQVPLELHFRPRADSAPDRILRVAPDLLPPGRVVLSAVWVNDEPYGEFDRDALTVQLPPESGEDLRVRVRIDPVEIPFAARAEFQNGTARVTCAGRLDPAGIGKLRRELERVTSANPSRVVFLMDEVESMCGGAVNEMLLVMGKIETPRGFFIVGSNEQVTAIIGEAAGAFTLVELESAIPK
jgi:mannose/cellobiose epimerase-like protein (N-acyl-D-glucosamine 2-epimerase family)